MRINNIPKTSFRGYDATKIKNLYMQGVQEPDLFCELKKAAKAVGEKNVEMIPMKELLKVAGYVHGGCSPIGMKKVFTTVIDETAILFDKIVFSGGKIGYFIEVNPIEIEKVIPVKFIDIVED